MDLMNTSEDNQNVQGESPSIKRLVILGSTGSIGRQTLEIVREQEGLSIVALAAGSNTALMKEQIREFHPAYAVMWEEKAAKELREKVLDQNVKILSGMDGLLEISSLEAYDVLVTAIVGMIGIRPTIAAIKAGKTIALANKETLVTAGHIIMPLAKQMNVRILPVDSEHSAIFQSMNGEPRERIARLWLTASGGPFRGKKREELANVRVEDALKHPNWSMGRKITIDSATMVNKGLEVMEAKWLFQVDYDRIKIVVHPQSIVHSMVEYVDGALIAQLGTPDMKLPIRYALFYPDRRPTEQKKLELSMLSSLTFEEPQWDSFTGLSLALRAGREGGSMPTVYNAANEKAVSLFLEGKITFLQISEIIGSCMERHKKIEDPDVDQILDVERETYEYIKQHF